MAYPVAQQTSKRQLLTIYQLLPHRVSVSDFIHSTTFKLSKALKHHFGLCVFHWCFHFKKTDSHLCPLHYDDYGKIVAGYHYVSNPRFHHMSICEKIPLELKKREQFLISFPGYIDISHRQWVAQLQSCLKASQDRCSNCDTLHYRFLNDYIWYYTDPKSSGYYKTNFRRCDECHGYVSHDHLFYHEARWFRQQAINDQRREEEDDFSDNSNDEDENNFPEQLIEEEEQILLFVYKPNQEVEDWPN